MADSRSSGEDVDVFISYDTADEDRAAELEMMLRDSGLSVWRDERVVTRAVSSRRRDVEEALERARRVIVLWSRNSVRSQQVHAEAHRAVGADKLVQLSIDGTSPPPSYARYHTLSWKGGRDDQLLRALGPSAREATAVAAAAKVELRLPTVGERLIGREVELEQLYRAWTSGQTRVVEIEGLGGSGKTALVQRFLDQLKASGWAGATRVFTWSFYSQGADDKRRGDADEFFQSALAWFGYEGEPIWNPRERVRALIRLIERQRTLMVLDGLEPLQRGGGGPPNMGRLKDEAVYEFIRWFMHSASGSMLVLTTRVAVPELRAAKSPDVQTLHLDRLSINDGMSLLRQLGVKSSDQELRDAVELLKGHPLSLNLLGSYAVNVHNGRLPVQAEMERLFHSSEMQPDAGAMMRRYEILLEEQVNKGVSTAGLQLRLLYIIGLFRRPITMSEIELLLDPVIEGLSDTPADRGTTRSQWPFAIDGLRRLNLLSPKTEDGDIDAHPIVREYFGRRLKEKHPDAFRAAHLRLYEHYKLAGLRPELRDPIAYGLHILVLQLGKDRFEGIVRQLTSGDFPPEQLSNLPPSLRTLDPTAFKVATETMSRMTEAAFDELQPHTLEQMAPLMDAVGHAAAAGEHDAAWSEVYFPRISRGPESYLVNKLGAVGADLATLAQFFAEPFIVPEQSLRPQLQRTLLTRAALRLRALGRLQDAQAPLVEALNRTTNEQDWLNAAGIAGDLAELRLAIGEVKGAAEAAQAAVKFAEMATDQGERISTVSMLAQVEHESGDLAAALGYFAEAEAFQKVLTSKIPYLYAGNGYRYCDALLSSGESSAVVERAKVAGELARQRQWLLPNALALLSLGRATAAAGNLKEAQTVLDEAVSLLRQSGQEPELARGLLARCELGYRQSGNAALAQADLGEVAEIATRSRLRLLDVDRLLLSARIALTVIAPAPETNVAAARKLADEAKAIIDATGYRRRLPDWHFVMGRIARETGDAASLRLHLAEVDSWIERGWRCHEAERRSLADAPPRPASAAPARREAFVFISCASADQPRLRFLVDALVKADIKVWIDQPEKLGYSADEARRNFYRVRVDQSFRYEVQQALNASAAVIGCWSKSASRVMPDELAIARMQGKLVSCRLDDVALSSLPAPYYLDHIVDLRETNPGRATAVGLLVEDVKRVMARTLEHAAAVDRPNPQAPQATRQPPISPPPPPMPVPPVGGAELPPVPPVPPEQDLPPLQPDEDEKPPRTDRPTWHMPPGLVEVWTAARTPVLAAALALAAGFGTARLLAGSEIVVPTELAAGDAPAHLDWDNDASLSIGSFKGIWRVHLLRDQHFDGGATTDIDVRVRLPPERTIARMRRSVSGDVIDITIPTGRTMSIRHQHPTLTSDAIAGSLLATGGDDGLVRLWQLPSDDSDPAIPLGIATARGDAVTALAFSPSGRWLAVASLDRKISIIDVEMVRRLSWIDGLHGVLRGK